MKKRNLVRACFYDSYFVRSMKDSKGIELKEDKTKSFLNQMMIYMKDEIDSITKITLQEITYSNDKYYLKGGFVIKENKIDLNMYLTLKDTNIYPKFEEKIYNSNTIIGIKGEYESIAYFNNNSLIFETEFGGYRAIIGGNYDDSTLQDNIINKTTSVMKNYVDRISGFVEEEFHYDKKSGLYIHTSVIANDEELILDINNVPNMIDPKNKLIKIYYHPVKGYAELLDERERLIDETKRTSLYTPTKKEKKATQKKLAKQRKRVLGK